MLKIYMHYFFCLTSFIIFTICYVIISKLVIKIYMSKYAIMFDNVFLILNFKVLKISVLDFKIINL